VPVPDKEHGLALLPACAHMYGVGRLVEHPNGGLSVLSGNAPGYDDVIEIERCEAGVP
jgi:hypothetical protein